MVIFTTLLEKTRTDDIIHHVRQKVLERREVQDKRRIVVKCWVPRCVGDARYLKAHAYYDHISFIFDERLDLNRQRKKCCETTVMHSNRRTDGYSEDQWNYMNWWHL